MNSIGTIKLFLDKLTEDEKKILFRYLSYNSKGENKLKSVKLVELLLETKNYSSVEIQKMLYGGLKYEAFSKLLNRLKQKIFEIIAFDDCLQSNQFSKRNKVLLDLRKKLLQADILQLKGIRNNILPLYNYIINKSRLFELYDIQGQALSSKQRLLSINSRLISFKKINEEITIAEKCNVALKTSNNIYLDFANKISNISSFNTYKNDLIESINKLERFYEDTSSPIIEFYLNTISAELYQNNFEYDKAQKCFENIKNILNNNESAYTSNRYGNILLNISNNNIFLGNYKEAIELANQSKSYFKNLPYTLKIVDELLFYAYYYNNDVKLCESLIQQSVYYDDLVIQNKFNYFYACLLFKKKKFNECISALENYSEIERDKEGWNINKRILLILSRIELDDRESTDLQIQNLEQYIKRISKNKVVKLRYSLVLRLLMKLVSGNYNFEYVFSKKSKYFQLLELNSSEYRWEIKSPELIVFHDWFKSKLSKS